MMTHVMRTIMLGAILAVAAAPFDAAAEGTLSIRLIRATRRAEGTDPALGDVAGALGYGFAFRGYTLAAQASQPLPADGREIRLGAYRVRCEGRRNALSIRVSRGRRRLIETTARLTGSHPLILGGFPAEHEDLYLLAFVAR